MSDRRPHWDDDLIDNVSDALGFCVVSMMSVPRDIYEVIAAVEDWYQDSMHRPDRLETCQQAEERSSQFEAQVQRVRDGINTVRQQAQGIREFGGGKPLAWADALDAAAATIEDALDGPADALDA